MIGVFWLLAKLTNNRFKNTTQTTDSIMTSYIQFYNMVLEEGPDAFYFTMYSF